MNPNSSGALGGSWPRQHVMDVLHRTGYPELADEAHRSLPDLVEWDQLSMFCRDHGISKDDLISRMGGSS